MPAAPMPGTMPPADPGPPAAAAGVGTATVMNAPSENMSCTEKHTGGEDGWRATGQELITGTLQIKQQQGLAANQHQLTDKHSMP